MNRPCLVPWIRFLVIIEYIIMLFHAFRSNSESFECCELRNSLITKNEHHNSKDIKSQKIEGKYAIAKNGTFDYGVSEL